MADRFAILPASTVSNWTSIGTWSATSGGATGASVPTSADAVFVDALSVAGAGAILSLNAGAACNGMNWTGATNNPEFGETGARWLNIYGNVTFIAAMTVNQPTTDLEFDANRTLTTSGITLTLGRLQIWGATLTLSDALNLSGTIDLENNAASALSTGNNNVDCLGVVRTTDGTITLGTNTITIGNSGWAAPTNFVANTSTIKVTGTGAFAGGGKTYYAVELNGTSHTISGSNTFTSLTFKADTTQTITFTDGTTQTVTTPTITGSVGKVKTLQGSAAAGWAITKAGGGTVVCSYMSISRSTANPAATWYANDGTSTNGGNNSGWIFEAGQPYASRVQFIPGMRSWGGM